MRTKRPTRDVKNKQAISSPENEVCNHVFEFWVWLDREKCMKCGEVKDKTERRRFILDSRGKIRDKEWLSKKLEMTSTDKKWKEDILSRRILPDGSVIRIKR